MGFRGMFLSKTALLGSRDLSEPFYYNTGGEVRESAQLVEPSVQPREVPSRQAQWCSARCAQLVSEADHAPQAHT